jgi:hypothetical protein
MDRGATRTDSRVARISDQNPRPSADRQKTRGAAVYYFTIILLDSYRSIGYN